MKLVPQHFAPLARGLHWAMAVMLLAMLFIGAGMVASVSERHVWLLNVHKPLGIALLALAVVRLCVRLGTRQPPLPADLPMPQALAAKCSHGLLYALMLILPVLGWAMVSAAGDPVTLAPGVQLPALLAANAGTFALLRKTHGYLAYLLFLTVLLHLAAALYHGLIRRDGVLRSMASGR
ncbi:cytochrome b [Pseudomonas typographi]|uniref:Cytochrome b n=1 Tax=Pseudomonas typographi TaxID=2715964 RepID=A0ABR7Z9U2_9PSED|nr:cytochrome b [Pseudomonas typographi]MBD1555127.1 cytochrome b [Pseudomonas typographi]MBD1590155.1 cytochrome b [Pseudomonas typographi]MBD1602190.1 cytochrome b [Pseudomonas typographi]